MGRSSPRPKSLAVGQETKRYRTISGSPHAEQVYDRVLLNGEKIESPGDVLNVSDLARRFQRKIGFNPFSSGL